MEIKIKYSFAVVMLMAFALVGIVLNVYALLLT